MSETKFEYDDDVEIEPTRTSRPWSRRAQLAGLIGWTSFLIAAAGTGIFFTFVDPEEMQGVMTAQSVSRMTAYGIGFFFLWLLTSVTAILMVYMFRTERRRNRERK